MSVSLLVVSEDLADVIHDSPEEVNMAGVNWSIFHTALGLKDDRSAGNVQGDGLLEALNKAEAILSDDAAIAEMVRPANTPAPNFHICGADADYLRRRMEEIKEILAFAHERGLVAAWG